MLVTEADARTLLCPLSFYYKTPITCRADRCMAWRPVTVRSNQGDPDIDKGYCGMAVKYEYVDLELWTT
jgi:hypothetical protein